MKLNKAQQIRDFIAAHPGTTNRAIIDALGFTPTYVASATTHDFKDGKLERRQTAQTITNAPIYGYWLPGTMPNNVVSPPDNVPVPPKAAAKPKSSALSIDGIIDQLAGALALQVASRLKDRLVDELQGLVPHASSDDPVRPLLEDIKARVLAAPPERKRLPVVLIVGLLPAQAGAIQNEFHDVYDLRFWKDESISQLKDLVRGADHVLTFTSKISHTAVGAIEAAGKKAVHVAGGMTSLRDVLTTMYVEQS